MCSVEFSVHYHMSHTKSHVRGIQVEEKRRMLILNHNFVHDSSRLARLVISPRDRGTRSLPHTVRLKRARRRARAAKREAKRGDEQNERDRDKPVANEAANERAERERVPETEVPGTWQRGTRRRAAAAGGWATWFLRNPEHANQTGSGQGSEQRSPSEGGARGGYRILCFSGCRQS